MDFYKIRLKNIQTLIIVTLLYVIVYFMLINLEKYGYYMMGYSSYYVKYSQYFIYVPLALILTHIVFGILYLIVMFCMCRKFGIFYLVYGGSITVLILFITLFTIPQVFLSRWIYVTDGYIERVIEIGGLEGIRTWLQEFNFPESQPQTSAAKNICSSVELPESQWPLVISELKPKNVYLRQIGPQKIVRLSYGSGLLGTFGLVMMEEPLIVPFDGDRYIYEYRIQILPDAFIWHDLRYNPWEKLLVSKP